MVYRLQTVIQVREMKLVTNELFIFYLFFLFFFFFGAAIHKKTIKK
jgi:hypothetical protein